MRSPLPFIRHSRNAARSDDTRSHLLVEAIEAEAGLFQMRTAIECELSLPSEVRVDPLAATAIYRIVQESLTNVARHSNATRVEIRLRDRAEELLLEVRDDGRGVTVEELSDPASLGLIGIRAP